MFSFPSDAILGDHAERIFANYGEAMLLIPVTACFIIGADARHGLKRERIFYR
jgi:hypothetical protein